jgi:type IV secretory pathway VirB9-like protein
MTGGRSAASRKAWRTRKMMAKAREMMAKKELATNSGNDGQASACGSEEKTPQSVAACEDSLNH